LTTQERPLFAILMLVTASTGAIDAICVLHLGVFAAYMTGTIVLVGLRFSSATKAPPTGGLIALACFALGAIIGGRIVRRRLPRNRLLADALVIVAGMVTVASLMTAFGDITDPTTHFIAIAILATAMGIQIAATRHRAVPDMMMPAATMVIHGLAYDSRLAGGRDDRYLRRFGVVISLMTGAALGAAIASWYVWLGLLFGALLIAMAATLIFKLLPIAADTP
jgi:uncharacterized membrane protein YoaK (UPF0700 family)